jgi:hypothetical protein
MVKVENQIRDRWVKKSQGTEIWIIQLEDLRVKLESVGSCIIENQFMIHILNNFTSYYDVQLAWMKADLMTLITFKVEEVRVEINLINEWLNMKSSSNEEGEVLEEKVLFSRQFIGKCKNCGQIGHNSFQWKNDSSHNDENNGNGTWANHFSYCRKPDHDKKSGFKLIDKEAQNVHSSNFNGDSERRNNKSQDEVFRMIFGFVTVENADIIASQ